MIEKIDRIILVGTSHIGCDDILKIEKIIEKNMPDVVCLELDIKRFKTLMAKNDNNLKQNNKKNSFKNDLTLIKQLGVFGFLFAKIAGFVQKKVGKKVGINPGIDMKTAYLKSRELKIPISLIDQDIKKTLKNLSKLSFFKKLNLVFSLFFKGLKKENRNLLNFDFKKVPEDKLILKMIKILEKQVPVLHKILILDRNDFMTKKLLKLYENHNGLILAFVGAGHVAGMKEILEKKLNNNQNQKFNSFNMNFKIEILE